MVLLRADRVLRVDRWQVVHKRVLVARAPYVLDSPVVAQFRGTPPEYNDSQRKRCVCTQLRPRMLIVADESLFAFFNFLTGP